MFRWYCLLRCQTTNILNKPTEIFGKINRGSAKLFTTASTEVKATENSSPSPTELKIPVPWGHIAAKQWGSSSGKPVLAVHGWQDNAGSFDTLAPLLPKDWNLVCVDLPGHGQSSHFPKGFAYYVWEYVSAIQEITAYLEWQKFNYIGHSMGSGIGLLYSSLFSENIDHLISLDLIKIPSVSGSNPRLQKELRKFFQEKMRFQKEYERSAPVLPLDEAVKKVMGKLNGSLTENSVKILMKRGAEFLPDGTVRFVRDRRLVLPLVAIALLSTEQLQNLFTFIDCKLLIIKAKSGIGFEKSKEFEKSEEFKILFAKHCKSLDYVEVEGTHHVHLNNPERVVDHIIKFIK